MSKAYKVVRRLEDGTLVSSFVDTIHEWPFVSRLVYRHGQITEQHKSSADGIYCHRELETALRGRDVSTAVPCTVEIHEVYPIGDEVGYWDSRLYPHFVTYPAVLFGKKVADVKEQE